MAISIRTAFKKAYSNRYNKLNILLYALIFAATPFLQKTKSILPILLGFVFSLCYIGICTLSANNAIRRYRKGVFPNLFKDFLRIFLAGIRTCLGGLFSAVILMFIPTIIYVLGMLFCNNQHNMIAAVILSILFAVCMIFGLIILICVNISFYITLKFSEFFNYKKALNFAKRAGGKLVIYILKGFLLCIITVLSSAIVAAPAIAVSMHSYIAVLYFVAAFCFTPVNIDLIRQFVWEVFPKYSKKRMPPEMGLETIQNNDVN